MRKIYIIDALVLDEDGVWVKGKRNKLQIVHLRQGDLDGACAVYSVFITLIILGVVTYDDIRIDGNEYDKRYSIEKLKKVFFDLKGLHRSGNYFFDEQEDNIKRMLESSYSAYIKVNHISEKGFDVIDPIDAIITANQPVLISIAFRGGGAHALVAIGIEYDKEGKPAKILCLDPGYDSPKFTYWNSVIDLDTKKRGKYIFRNITETGDCHDVQLLDILEISKR